MTRPRTPARQTKPYARTPISRSKQPAPLVQPDFHILNQSSYVPDLSNLPPDSLVPEDAFVGWAIRSIREDVKADGTVTAKDLLWECKLCGKVLSANTTFRDHLGNVHHLIFVQRRCAVPTCPVIRYASYQINTHQANDHPEHYYDCGRKGNTSCYFRRSIDIKDVRKHLETAHKIFDETAQDRWIVLPSEGVLPPSRGLEAITVAEHLRILNEYKADPSASRTRASHSCSPSPASSMGPATPPQTSSVAYDGTSTSYQPQFAPTFEESTGAGAGSSSLEDMPLPPPRDDWVPRAPSRPPTSRGYGAPDTFEKFAMQHATNVHHPGPSCGHSDYSLPSTQPSARTEGWSTQGPSAQAGEHMHSTTGSSHGQQWAIDPVLLEEDRLILASRK